jgi:hypothetical protein
LAIPAGELTQRMRLIDTKLQTIPRPPGDWQLVRPIGEMRSQIALLKSTDWDSGQSKPDTLRNAWLAAGSVVSAFTNGVVRVSFAGPAKMFANCEVSQEQRK